MNKSQLHFPKIGSTNTYAKEHAQDFDRDTLTIISAGEQTEGRGRGTHTWTSPPGVNLYLSFCSFVSKDFHSLHNCAQLLALSCSDLLRQLGLSSALKWPNDVLIQQKKVAGILCDLVDCGDQTLVVNGMGLNVNLSEEECSQISENATSLFVESGQKLEREDLKERLINIYSNHWSQFQKEGFSPFLETYRNRLMKVHAFHVEGQLVEGEFHSLGDDGSLNIVLADGQIANFV